MYSGEDVKMVLKQAVEDYGSDWIDENAMKGKICVNSYIGSKGEVRHCIAGYVFNELAPDLTVQEVANVKKVEVCNGTDWPFDAEATKMLRSAQLKQDFGDTWGEVLASVE